VVAVAKLGYRTDDGSNKKPLRNGTGSGKVQLHFASQEKYRIAQGA
jgi:hypothetical protein